MIHWCRRASLGGGDLHLAITRASRSLVGPLLTIYQETHVSILAENFEANLQYGVPLRGFTTLGIGGPAKRFIAVRSVDELLPVLQKVSVERTDYLLIGGGSNLLVSDEGTDCLVIRNEMTGIETDDDLVVVKSGTSLQTLVDYTISHGLAGIQRMTGIPGTVGGAVYGNAGAYGQTISDSLVDVAFFDGRRIATVGRDECGFDYRYSAFKKTRYPIVEARFRFSTGESALLAQEAGTILAQRLVKYPVGLKCPGSFL